MENWKTLVTGKNREFCKNYVIAFHVVELSLLLLKEQNFLYLKQKCKMFSLIKTEHGFFFFLKKYKKMFEKCSHFFLRFESVDNFDKNGQLIIYQLLQHAIWHLV